MSDDESEGRTPRTVSRTRRLLLKRATLCAAGSSIAAGLPVINHAATREAAPMPPTNCSEMKAPMRNVEGKVAFITGGSSGIGLGIAQAFARAKMKVVIGYRTRSHLDKALKSLDRDIERVHAISVDVTDRRGMERAAEETVRIFGKAHVLVCNAGVLHPASLSNTTYDDWDWVMNVNLTGVFNGVRAFLPHIRAHAEGGQIIATSSMAGLAIGGGTYSTSKFGVVGMMESLRAELANANVGVSVFCPGVVPSNITESNRNRPGSSSDSRLISDASTMAVLKKSMNDPDISMDALKAGQFVLRGLLNNDLYILTNPEFEPLIRDRCEAIVTSFPTGVYPTDAQAAVIRARRAGSIYKVERDRKRCSQETRGMK